MPVTTPNGISLNPDNNNYFVGQSMSEIIANNLNRSTFVLDNPDGVTVNLDSFSDATLHANNNAADEINLDQKLAETIRIYQAAFNREPDEEGLEFWADLYINGSIDFNHMAEEFVNSEEFKDDFEGLNIEDTVEKIYENVLGRASEPEGKAFWVNELEEGNITLAQTLQLFANSQENVENTQETVATFSQSYNEANGNNAISTSQIDELDTFNGSASADTVFIKDAVDEDVAATARLYMAVLGREPEMEGLEYWVNQQKDGISNFTQVAGHFIHQPEFIGIYDGMTNGQIVDTLYQNILGRAPEEAGRNYWTNQLDTGADTLAVVLASFANSDEFVGKSQQTIENILQEYKEYTGVVGEINTNAGNDTITIEDADVDGILIDTGLGQDISYLDKGSNISLALPEGTLNEKVFIGNNGSGVNVDFSEVINDAVETIVDLRDPNDSYMVLNNADGQPIVEIWGTSSSIMEMAQQAGVDGLVTAGEYNKLAIENGVPTIDTTPITDEDIDGLADEIDEDGNAIEDPITVINNDGETPVSDTPVDNPIVTDDPGQNPDPDFVQQDPFADDNTTPVADTEPDPQDVLPSDDGTLIFNDDGTVSIDDGGGQTTIDTDALFAGQPANTGAGTSQESVDVSTFMDVADDTLPADETAPAMDADDANIGLVGVTNDSNSGPQFDPFS